MPALRRSDKQGLRGGPAWPRRADASDPCDRIRNAENRIHASGLDRRAWNVKPGLDMPERNCRNIGILLLDAGRVDLAVADLKPYRRFEALAACRSDPASWKAPASASSGASSKEPGAFGRKREPTPCSPSNAASKTGAGPTSSMGGLAAPQPHNQKMGCTPLDMRDGICRGVGVRLTNGRRGEQER